MILLLHVGCALTSLGFSFYTLLRPSTNKLRVSNSFIVATLASGTYLVVSAHAALLKACVSGLVFIAVSMMLSRIAHYRLAGESENI